MANAQVSDVAKRNAARAALQFVEQDSVVGVGSGSTVHFFIEALAEIKQKIDGAVASSIDTEKKLKQLNIPIVDLNSLNQLPLYVDGADEVNAAKQLIKGGGGALTREKIIATVAKKFICIIDNQKKVPMLGDFPVAVEVLPMARSYVARQIVKLGGDPVYRSGFITDNGNVILDVHHLKLIDPKTMEEKLKNIVGVVESGIFSNRCADLLLIGDENGFTQE